MNLHLHGSKERALEGPNRLDSASQMRRRVNRTLDRIAAGAMTATVVAIIALLVAPLAITVALSFDAREYLGPFPPQRLSIGWYQRFFSDDYLTNGLRTSLLLAVISAIAATTLGIAAALAIKRLPKG